MNESFINFLEQDETAIVHAWQARLGDAANLAANQLEPESHSPVRVIFREMLRLLRVRQPDPHWPLASGAVAELRPLPDWRINLCQAVEVILTGQVVVRSWTRANFDASDGELLELSDQVEGVFHQLIRAYTLRYCNQCRANDKAREE